jgi:hypothetical protein
MNGPVFGPQGANVVSATDTSTGRRTQLVRCCGSFLTRLPRAKLSSLFWSLSRALDIIEVASN